MNRFQFCIITCVLTCLCTFGYAQKMVWPDGKKAAIVLTYDDGLPSHRNIVIPQLDKAGFKATFYLIGKSITRQDMLDWGKISRSGHELGNHSLFHPCLARNEEPSCTTLENYTIAKMLQEISIMNQLLSGIDGGYMRTYAYPCEDAQAGGQDYSVPLSQSGMINFARGVGIPITTDFDQLNYFSVPAMGTQQGESSQRLIEYMKEVKEKEGLGILVFHGVGGDYLSISAEVHQELLDYLSKNQDIWVTTFANVMKYVSEHKKQ